MQTDWCPGKISKSIVIAIFVGGLLGACGNSEPSRIAIGLDDSDISSISQPVAEGIVTDSTSTSGPLHESASTISTQVSTSGTSTFGPPSTLLDDNKKVVPLVPAIGVPSTPPPPDTPLVSSSLILKSGGRLSVAASGFQPRSKVRLVMYSTPIDLGQTTSSNTGSISQEVQIPTSVPSGRHTITAIGIDAGGETYVASIGVVIDNDGPEITSITVSQDTLAPGDNFTISINANDPLGVESVGFWFTVNGGQRDFCGQGTTRTSGTAENGTWTYNCTIPSAVIAGTYTVTPYARDSLQNWTNTNCCTTSPARATFTINGGIDDNDGPQITSITVSQDTLAPGDNFTISINANDPLGVESVGFWFTVNGGQRDFCGQGTTRTSGTAENGTWTYNCTIPSAVIAGTYTVTPYARDSLQNWTNTNCCTTSPARATFTIA